MKKAMVVFAAFLVALIAVSGWASGPPAPEYWPLCQSPQNIAPYQPIGGSEVYAHSPVVWNGKDFATVWVDYYTGYLYFRRFYADGMPAMDAWPLFSAYYLEPPALVWNGNGYGLAFTYWDGSHYSILFSRLGTDGHAMGSLLKASCPGCTPSYDCHNPGLAWSGNGYAVVWDDSSNQPGSGPENAFATLLYSDGSVATSRFLLSDACPPISSRPAVGWSSLAGSYFIAWQLGQSIYGRFLSPSLNETSLAQLASPESGAVSCERPSIADGGTSLGLVYGQYCNTTDVLAACFFVPIIPFGTSPTYLPAVRLGDETHYCAAKPQVVWTGAEYGVFWDNYCLAKTLFQRVNASGSLPGGSYNNAMLAFAGANSTAAFAKYGFLVSSGIFEQANFLQAFGCNYAYNPPCPESPVAYSITGTGATIAWLPSLDTSTDIAYYSVYRNDALIAKTSGTFYADTGLSPGTTYFYAIHAVNAADYESTGCTGATLYIKSNATLTLMLNKNTTDANLNWTDITLNNYNIFRGTSPQVMQQIGSTSGQSFDDPNVLTNNVLYFYTVDEPGQ